jgi:thermitase
LQRNPSIQSVSLNPRYTVLQAYPPLARQNTGAAPNADMAAPRRLNDAFYPLQWALPKVGIPQAWNYARGSADLLVAVVDSGIDYNHPDLAGQIVNGIDFMPEMPSGPNGEGSPDTTDMDPNDELGHGTHVAGIIAAHAENQMGVAGIAPNVKILNVKVLNADGWGSSFAIAQGITFAADKGARIINLSLGGPDISKPIELAVKYAQKKGALVIAAAGNSFTHTGYPAAFPGVFAVGATDDNDRLADFSNHDARINVMAPGVDIMSTTPMNLTNSMQAGGVDSQYSAMSGTSMACPIVTGQAALILSARPDMTAFQVKQLIEQTAKPVGDARIFGHGRIQIAESLKQLAAAPPANPAPADPAAPPVAAQSFPRR